MKVLTPGRWAAVLASLAALLAAAVLIGIISGSAEVGVRQVLSTLTGREESEVARLIILQVRLPRVLLAAVIGAALSAAGVAFQALLRNPLADPFIIGVSGGSAFGAVIAISAGLDVLVAGVSPVPVFSFAGAMGTMAAIYFISRVRGRVPIYTLLLVGVIFNAFYSAVIMFITSVVDFTSVLRIVFWLMGNLTSVPYRNITVVAVYVALGCALLLAMCGRLNLLSLGEETAGQLGVNVERTKAITFFAASLVTGAAVSAAGMIGFVGLMVPHAVRLLVGPDHRLLMPASILGGASFLILADVAARTIIAPTEIPVGVVTAICGGPFFIWLLKARQDRATFG